MRSAQDAIAKMIGNHALVVVGENERVHVLESREQQAENFLLSCGSQWLSAFSVDADDLLVAGDDACLERGHARIGDDAFVDDTGRLELTSKRMACAIIS